MSVTRTTIEETMRKLNEGEWEALSAITEHGMVLLRNEAVNAKRTRLPKREHRGVPAPRGAAPLKGLEPYGRSPVQICVPATYR